MVNEEMARNLIANAELYLSEAEGHFEPGHWHLCVRRSQETIEAATKAALRIVGVEPPRLHDTSQVLRAERSRFPAWFQERLPDFEQASVEASKHRELSYYGNEQQAIPPSRLYDESKAHSALDAARHVFHSCSRLVSELSTSGEGS